MVLMNRRYVNWLASGIVTFAAVHKVTSGFIGKVVFAVGLSFFMGCSQQTASKPQEDNRAAEGRG